MKQKSVIPSTPTTYKGKKVVAECEGEIKTNGCVSVSRTLKGQKAIVLVCEETP